MGVPKNKDTGTKPKRKWEGFYGPPIKGLWFLLVPPGSPAPPLEFSWKNISWVGIGIWPVLVVLQPRSPSVSVEDLG